MKPRTHQLITMSARSEEAVRRYAADLATHLQRVPEQRLGDIAHTFHIGRRHHDHRLTLTAESRDGLIELCGQAAESEWGEEPGKLGSLSYSNRAKAPTIAFLFTGQGTQYSGMGRDLYESSSVFRDAVDRCAEAVKPDYPLPLTEYMFNPEHSAELNRIHVSSACMFTVEYALAQLWLSWGIKPSYVVGQSLGEIVAACIAGAIEFRDALRITVERGRLMHEETEEGGTISVNAPLDVINGYIEDYPDDLGIATVNGAEQYLVSGRKAAVDRLVAQLEADGVIHKVLPISIAAHSPLMEPPLPKFKAFLDKIPFQPLQIPLISNLDGQVLHGKILDADYWCRHLRHCVKMSLGFETLQANGVTAFLEIGPHPVLRALAENVATDEQIVLASLNRKEPGWKTILESLGQLWAEGMAIDWQGFDRDFKHKRVHAPTYPFEANSYWVEVDRTMGLGVAQQQVAATSAIEAAEGTTAKKQKLADRPTVEVLTAFWREILGVREIQPDDSFFKLGGESLNVIQLQGRLKKSLGLKVTVKELFAHAEFEKQVAFISDLRGIDETAETAAPAASAERADYPLSPTQRRLWFLFRIDPQNTAYNAPLDRSIREALDLDAFRSAYRYMLERHSALRTVFFEKEGVPGQRIQPLSDAYELRVEDISSMSADEQRKHLITQTQADITQPFDLSAGPLFRATLYKLGEADYHLHANHHHIITDAWSMDLFERELNEAYRAIAQGGQPNLPPALQYVDYVDWYEREQQAGRWAEEEQYWLDALQKPLPMLNLPLDFPRPEIQTFNGDMVVGEVPQELHQSLRDVARKQDASLFMIAFSAYQMLLHLLTQDEDIIVGTPIAGRITEELEGVFGFFANSLAIRTRFDGVNTLADLLERVKKQSLEAFENQSCPFDVLIDKVSPERDASRTPIFSTMLVFRNVPGGEGDARLLLQQPRDLQADEAGFSHGSKFDLTLIVSTVEDHMYVLFEYNSDLFKQDTIHRFQHLYQTILGEFVARLETPIAELPLLVDADQDLYAKLNDTHAEFPAELTIHERFYQQAALHAELPALSDEHGVLTYAELNERSNQIAHLLQGRGVGREQVVGIMMERSIETVISILGVLKSGGAFVPIDPEYPEDRVRYMLEDSGAALLLTKRHLLDRLPGGESAAILVDEVPGDVSRENLPVTTVPQDLAYMIYTSGSTGRPKGTMLHHVGVLNLMQWKKDRFDYGPADTILQFASFSFDASIWEAFPALLNGARLHLLANEQRQSIDAFADAVAEQKATIVTLPTVFFNQLGLHLREEDLGKFTTMKRIFVAGEALQGEVVRAWQRRFGTGIQIINAYGPTEATVCATVHEISGPVAPEQAHIPIGTPIANNEIYILNRWMQPCPVGVVGELYIGAVGLARGYLHQPEKTAEAFIPHPFSPEPGAVLYRSGDMARLLPDGTIEYAGRRDAQVKVRGHRIEIGEIEDVLTRYPSVQDAAVVATRDGGPTRLVAYYSVEEGAEAAVAELRDFLSQKLPDYMVPALFVRLDAMPLTPNGKIDRKDLEARELTAVTDDHVPPRNELEQRVHDAWQRCIGQEQISVFDNFFHIGGDSIVLMQVVSNLNQSGFKVKTADLFKHQTIADLARLIEENGLYADSAASGQEAVVGEVPLSAIQRWVFADSEMDREFYFMPAFLDIGKPVDAERLEQALKRMIGQHDMLRAVYVPDGDAVKQTILAPDAFPFELLRYDLSALEPEAARRECERIEMELKASVKFNGAGMIPAALIKLGDASYRFLWLLHHLVDDVVSLRILIPGLIETYEALAAGQEPLLPEKTTSYKDWVEIGTRFIHSEHGAEALAFWKPVIEARKQHATRLPIDDRDGSNLIEHARNRQVFLDEETTEMLMSGIHAKYNTNIKEILLSAVVRSLARWMGQEQVLLEFEGHGRDDLHPDYAFDLTRTVGWFTNVYPFLATVGEGEAVGSTITQIRESLQAVPYGGVTFGLLRYLSEDPEVRAAFEGYRGPEISYNFFGQFKNDKEEAGGWHLSEPLGSNNGAGTASPFQLTINGAIRDGRLLMNFNHSTKRYQPETIEALATIFAEEIRAIIAECSQ